MKRPRARTLTSKYSDAVGKVRRQGSALADCRPAAGTTERVRKPRSIGKIHVTVQFEQFIASMINSMFKSDKKSQKTNISKLRQSGKAVQKSRCNDMHKINCCIAMQSVANYKAKERLSQSRVLSSSTPMRKRATCAAI